MRVGARIVPCIAMVAMTVVLAVSEPAGAAVPDGFEDTLVARITQPMDIDWTPDGRMLVPTKLGQIRVLEPDGDLLPTAALDISAQVCTFVEQGLQSLALHPDFEENGWIYVYYTYPKFGPCDDVAPVNRLSRFVLPPSNVIDPASEVVLLETPQVNTTGHHNGGDIEFGRDGYLYVTIGDLHQRTNATDPGRLQGKIVRLTDTGDIPPEGNTYTGEGSARCNVDGVPPEGSAPGTTCQEIYAKGLRNPFRLVLDPFSPTTRFLVNDVGADFWEEINELTEPGHDFGWGRREGPCRFNQPDNCTPEPEYTDPIHWYDHQGIGGAITGAAFVPPGVWPSEYDGVYLFADYALEQIFMLQGGGADCRLCAPPTSPYTNPVFAEIPRLVDMAFGTLGGTEALYYVSREGNQLRRITYVGDGNRSPIAVADASPTSGATPLLVQFDGSGSWDPDGDELTYTWDFGDGSPVSHEQSPQHTFTSPGAFFVELTVEDGNGGSSTDVVRIDSDNLPPVPVIETPSASHRFTVGEVLTLTGSAVDPEDGPLPDSALTWEVRQHHHTHFHPYLTPTPGNGHTIVTPPPEDFFSTEDSHLEILLTATDSEGLSTTVSQLVLPLTTQVTFTSVPSGLELEVEGQGITTPLTVTGWVGWELELVAPDQTDGGGNPQNWVKWSDGGAQSHVVTLTEDPATFTATFDAIGVRVLPGAAAVGEGDDGTVVVSVPVTLNRPADAPVTVDWETVDAVAAGIARSGVDFAAASGQLVFAPGDTEEHIDITVHGDTTFETPFLGGEWGLIRFTGISPNALLDGGFFGHGVFVVVDDDPQPVVRSGVATVVEGDDGTTPGQVTITLSNPSDQTITVDWTAGDVPSNAAVATPAVDFTPVSGTVTFAPGQTSATIDVDVIGDTDTEDLFFGAELALFVLSNPVNATIDPGSGFFGASVLAIMNDD